MRASIRGSIRKVMVTDSDSSEPAATAASISRKSSRFSAQNADSPSSLSKSGTSSQVLITFMTLRVVFVGGASRRAQGLVHFPLIKELLLRLERPGMDDPRGLPVRAVNGQDAGAVGGHSQVEEPRLGGEPGGVAQEADGE